MSQFSMIELGLWVGGQPEPYHFPRHVEAVVNLRREAYLMAPWVKAALWLPVADAAFPGLPWLGLAADGVARFRQLGWSVLVHCLMGVSRAVLVTAAYLIRYRGLRACEALDRIVRARPIADPNPDFRRGLVEFEAAAASQPRNDA